MVGIRGCVVTGTGFGRTEHKFVRWIATYAVVIPTD